MKPTLKKETKSKINKRKIKEERQQQQQRQHQQPLSLNEITHFEKNDYKKITQMN